MVTFNEETKLPSQIDNFFVMEDGTLERDGQTIWPWISPEGYTVGHVRYRLVAEEVSNEELAKIFKTQERLRNENTRIKRQT